MRDAARLLRQHPGELDDYVLSAFLSDIEPWVATWREAFLTAVRDFAR